MPRDASPARLQMLTFIEHPQKIIGNSNLGDTTDATASAEWNLGNTEILHRQALQNILSPIIWDL